MQTHALHNSPESLSKLSLDEISPAPVVNSLPSLSEPRVPLS